MKRISFILFVLSFSLFSGKINISILRIEPIGLSSSFSRSIDNLLQNEFLKYPALTVVERDRLESVLQEQKIQLTGLTSTVGAVKVGRILNVQKIIMGSISNFGGRFIKYILTIKVVDVETGTIDFAITRELKNKEEIRRAVKEIVKTIVNKLNREVGKVSVVKGNTIYIDIGKNQGVETGELFTCYSVNLIKDNSGRVIMKEEIPVGTIKVVAVDDEGAKCEIVQGRPEAGNLVKPGPATRHEKRKGIISIKSIPENAKAYLDGQYIGKTPLEISMKPGDYILEIRKSGYSSYRGKVRLRSGRKVVVQKELKRVIELEDLFGGGNIPREKTSPSTALKRAFIPGLGEMYNGNFVEGGVVQFNTLLYGALAYLYLSQVSNATDERDKHDPNSTDYWDARDYYEYDRQAKANMLEGIIFAGFGGLQYIYSIIGSYQDASAEFQHLSYFYITFGGAYDNLNVQTAPDRNFSSSFNSVVDDISFQGLTGKFGFGFSGKRTDFLLNILFSDRIVYILLSGDLKFPMGKNASILISSLFSINQSQPSGFDWTVETPSTVPGEKIGIGAGFKYESPRMIVEIKGYPYVVGSGWTFIQSSSNWADKKYISGLKGWEGDLSLTYYTSMRTGFRLNMRYSALSDAYPEMNDAGFSTITSLKELLINTGVVYRF